jgi:hypothetical protein
MMAIRGTQSRSPASDLEALANLRDRGVLSDAEFEAQKRKLLDSD